MWRLRNRSPAIVDSGAREVVVVAARPSALDVARAVKPPPGNQVRGMDPSGEAYLLAAAAVHQPLRSAEHDPVAAINDAIARDTSVSCDAYRVGEGHEFARW